MTAIGDRDRDYWREQAETWQRIALVAQKDLRGAVLVLSAVAAQSPDGLTITPAEQYAATGVIRRWHDPATGSERIKAASAADSFLCCACGPVVTAPENTTDRGTMDGELDRHQWAPEYRPPAAAPTEDGTTATAPSERRYSGKPVPPHHIDDCERVGCPFAEPPPSADYREATP